MKYRDMSYIDFLENVLGVKLTDEQKTMLELFEENKKQTTYNPILPTPIEWEPKVTCSNYNSVDEIVEGFKNAASELFENKDVYLNFRA